MKRLSTHNVDLGDKQRMRRFIASPLTFVVIIFLIAVVGWNTWDMYTKWRTSNEALAEAQVAYQELQAREAFLARKIELLSTDVGIEAEVRDRFGVAKAGEKVIVILNEEKRGLLIEEEKSWWATFKGWFGIE